MSADHYILRAAAPDGIGILADVMGVLAKHRLNVLESHDFGDPETKRFFIWARFAAGPSFDQTAFEHGFQALSQKRNLDWSLRRTDQQPRAL
ncbi:MAG: hypothetical protein AAGH90_03360, partial [Pseudomonadota bacterium]